MNVLLDTHALLWFYLDDPKLSARVKSTIEIDALEVFISAASYWEIAIKMNVGKLKLTKTFDQFVQLVIGQYGFATLPIEPRHASEYIKLPSVHRDPFDRMLAAQARVEKMPLLSSDVVLDQYGITRIW